MGQTGKCGIGDRQKSPTQRGTACRLAPRLPACTPVASAAPVLGSEVVAYQRLPKVATEMALHVLAYNITRAMNILGVDPLIAAMRA
jgi:hypothetical protein